MGRSITAVPYLNAEQHMTRLQAAPESHSQSAYPSTCTVLLIESGVESKIGKCSTEHEQIIKSTCRRTPFPQQGLTSKISALNYKCSP